jgi:hypothetical protein
MGEGIPGFLTILVTMVSKAYNNLRGGAPEQQKENSSMRSWNFEDVSLLEISYYSHFSFDSTIERGSTIGKDGFLEGEAFS